MNTIAKKAFIEEMRGYKGYFNINSTDGGSVYLSFGECLVVIDEVGGTDGEISFVKPNTGMDISIDFAIIEEISHTGESYIIEFSNGLPDIEMTYVK